MCTSGSCLSFKCRNTEVIASSCAEIAKSLATVKEKLKPAVAASYTLFFVVFNRNLMCLYNV